MIYLYSNKQRVKEFKNFDYLLEYINLLENSPLDDYNSYYEHQKWKFIYHPYRKLSNHCEPIANQAFTAPELEAFEQQLDLIEIYSGDSQSIEQIVVTPDLDVAGLIKNWCFHYCYAKGLVLLEIFPGTFDSEQSGMNTEEYFLEDTFKQDKIIPVAHNSPFWQ
jgi:hypothetical protein